MHTAALWAFFLVLSFSVFLCVSFAISLSQPNISFLSSFLSNYRTNGSRRFRTDMSPLKIIPWIKSYSAQFIGRKCLLKPHCRLISCYSSVRTGWVRSTKPIICILNLSSEEYQIRLNFEAGLPPEAAIEDSRLIHKRGPQY